MLLGFGYTRAVKLIGVPRYCAICEYVFDDELKKPMTSSKEFPHQPTIEHLRPRSRGGKDNKENLRWACFSCNQAKGDKDEL
jgi:5-methylcytosine-specific restriction endonuclease McrA